MIRATLFAVVLGIVAFFIYLAFYTGYYKPISIQEVQSGPFILLSKEHIGAYHKIVPVIEEVEAWAKSKGLDCSRSMGLYLDNPKVAEEIRLKSRGGCVLSERLPISLSDQLPEGITESVYPDDTAEPSGFVMAQFDGAAGIGPLKVYPAVISFIEEHRLAFEGWNVLEIYEVKGPREMTTTYYFPLLSSEPLPQ